MTQKMSTNKENDRMLLVISIIFAIFLWLYVRSEVDPEKTIVIKDVNVRLENLAEIKANNLEVVSPSDPKVTVKLTGKQSNISKINKDSVSASVDLSGYYAGEYKMPIRIQIDGNSIIVDSKSPELISIKIDKVVNNKMDCNIITKGSVAESYVLGNIKESEEVEVIGAQTYVDKIAKITSSFNVSGKSESSVMTSVVEAFDKEGNKIKEVSFKPDKITLDLPILKTQTIPIKLNIVGNIPEGMDEKDFYVEPNSVTVKGNSSVLKEIEELTTEAINVNSLINTQKTIDVNLPDGVSLVDKDIKFVASSQPITLKKQKISINKDDIKIENLDESFKCIFEDNAKIDIIITPKDPLSKLEASKDQISASINLSELQAGKHDVKLNIDVDQKYRIISIEPNYLKIELEKKGILN